VQIRLVPLRDAEVGDIRPYLLLLVAAVALVLLICCANVANLLLARAATREREMAIRAALGAGRLRLMRLLLTESLLLALAGASCGLGLAYPALQALLALIPVELPFWMKIELDWRSLAFSLAAAVLTSLLFGLAPAWQSARVELSLALKNGAKGTGGGAQRLRSGLIVAEIAFSLLLLLGAGLMMQSFLRLLLVDPGIKTERLLTVEAGRFVANTNPMERAQGYINPHRRALARLAQLPGVVAVSGGNDFPYRDQPDQRQKVEIAVIGQSEREQRQSAPAVAASTYPGYFNALGIPLYAGRDFNEADDLNAARVAIVSRRAAGSLWPGREAVGQMIRLGKEGPDNSWSRVVGVVGDTKWQAAEQGRGYEIYFPYLQGPGPGFHYLLRVEGDPQTVASALRQAIKEAASGLQQGCRGAGVA
jgi:putative ABC transport system permease protein